MLRQDREIADSLVVMAICIGLPVAGASYARNIPDPVARTVQADEAAPAWMDPKTTGAIAQRASGTSEHVEVSRPDLRTGSTAWVDPHHQLKVNDRLVSAIDQTMELRLPRL